MIEFARALPSAPKGGEPDVRQGASRASESSPVRVRLLDRGLLPHRRRGVRGGERELRARDDEEEPRHPRRRLRDHVRLSGQERQAADPQPRRPGRLRGRAGAQAAAGGRARAPRLPGRRLVVRRALAPTSTRTSRRRRAATSPPRTSAPGPAPCSRPSGSRSRAKRPRRRPRGSAPSPARSRRSRTTSATRRPSPGPRTSTRGSSTATSSGVTIGGVLDGPRRRRGARRADLPGRGRGGRARPPRGREEPRARAGRP